MTLDCTNLKPGDRVRLRNGEIRTVQENDGTSMPIFLGDSHGWNYANGSYTGDGEEDERDIIEILPPEPPTDCTSRDQAMARARQITENLRKHMESTPGTRVLSVTHDLKGFEHPDVIDCNGKRYVPLDSQSFSFGAPPFTIITHPEKGVVALRYDGIKYTPADAWPEPITDRAPTKDDADPDGNVQCLTGHGDWSRFPWDAAACRTAKGWARTSGWKPKPTPAHTREEVLDILRDNAAAERSIGADLLASIIDHLEASE